MIHKITKILAGTDFSEPSFNAIQMAARLAVKCNASLFIIHARDNILDFMGINTLTVKSIANNSSRILNALGNDIQKKFGINPVIIEQEAQANEAILKAAVKYQCELIVLGTYGASGYRSGYIGYTAYNIIKFAICPILLIPSDKEWPDFRNPLYPIRPTGTALQHIEMLNDLFDKDSALGILGLYPPGQGDDLYDLKDLIAKVEPGKKPLKIKLEQAVYDAISTIPRKILMQADKNQSDLLIITPTIDLTTKPFYIGPNTHYIIQNARIPLLIIDKISGYPVKRSKISL